jgi:hypothetical protein
MLMVGWFTGGGAVVAGFEYGPAMTLATIMTAWLSNDYTG